MHAVSLIDLFVSLAGDQDGRPVLGGFLITPFACTVYLRHSSAHILRQIEMNAQHRHWEMIERNQLITRLLH